MIRWVIILLHVLSCSALASDWVVTYRVEPGQSIRRFDETQLRILEKVNRADRIYLARLPRILVPDTWNLDELTYSPLPKLLPAITHEEKRMIVDLPSQVFGAYERGVLVRWGPISSGRARFPTPEGEYHLNWKSPVRRSTDNPDWRMRWYFNFHNKRGLAFHEYGLPGHPASHACIRLLTSDAKWIYEWGQGWVLSDDGQRVLLPGTPVLIQGKYDFLSRPPWTDPAWWTKKIPVNLTVFASGVRE